VHTNNKKLNVLKLFKNLWQELAGGQGFEPRLMEPESIVLPLDDPPALETQGAEGEAHSVWFRINEMIRKVNGTIF
jgi:hypothetical protein